MSNDDTTTPSPELIARMIVVEYWDLKLDEADGEWALITERFDANLFSYAVRLLSYRGFFSLDAIQPAMAVAGTVSRQDFYAGGCRVTVG